MMLSSKKLARLAGPMLALCIAAAAPVITATAAYASDTGTTTPAPPLASTNGNPWHG
jgi:hypothetical protein